MDPHKVNTVLNWKTPTNRDLLRGFLGSSGYLADDVPKVRIPMGVQRAFEDVKASVSEVREHRRKPISYKPGAPPIWLVTDGCSSGISGVVCQGEDWKGAKVAAFFSAKRD